MRENGFRVPAAYQGITGVAHGGYVAGLFAQRIGEAGRVTLRRPPPLEAPLVVDGRSLVDETGQTIMEIGPAADLDEKLPVIGRKEAGDLPNHPRLADHPYPACFMCGTARPDGFGLRVTATPTGSATVAVWTPHGPLLNEGPTVSAEFVWAVVDCLTVWSFADHWDDAAWWPAVTGQIQVEQLADIRRDEPYVMVGRLQGRDGRKITVDAAIGDAGGRVRARGRARWVVVRGEAPNRPADT